MPRTTKKDLEEQLSQYKEWLERSEKRCQELVKNAEIEFANSVTKKQMEEQLKLYKNLYELAEKHNANERKWKYRMPDTIRKIYEDNKAFMEGWSEADYEVGITKWYDTRYLKKENTELLDQKQELQGLVDAKDLAVRRRDELIKGYIEQIISLEAEKQVILDASKGMLPSMDTAAARLAEYKEENRLLKDRLHAMQMDMAEPEHAKSSYEALERELKIAKEQLSIAEDTIRKQEEHIQALKEEKDISI